MKCIMQELVDASEGQLRIFLSQQRPALALPALHATTSPIHWARRLYGWLLIAADPLQPTRPLLSFASSRALALNCAVLFYSLEVSALLLGGGHTPGLDQGSLTKREQEVYAE